MATQLNSLGITFPDGSTQCTCGGGGGAASPMALTNQTISANYTIPTGYNGISLGPVLTCANVYVCVPPGQRWMIL